MGKEKVPGNPFLRSRSQRSCQHPWGQDKARDLTAISSRWRPDALYGLCMCYPPGRSTWEPHEVNSQLEGEEVEVQKAKQSGRD